MIQDSLFYRFRYGYAHAKRPTSVEERENINFFGAEYVEYMRHSKMFIPFVF